MPTNTEHFLNETGLGYYHDRISNVFATQTALAALQDEVDEIVAEGGEPNVIDSISVNGTPVAPDAQKNVEITVPTATSDLTNDGDGQSVFATESYVQQHGGKIDVIKVNGAAQTITNKEVDIEVPTAVSDLTNDSGYQTAADVSAAISTAVASAYKYKGSVATVDDLPASGNTVGDVWDVQATGVNYAWNGTAWDALGAYVDTSLYWAKSELTAITTAQIDALFA